MSNRIKSCIITGSNSGIGKQAAIQIARAGWHVVMACRSEERGTLALEEVQKESGSDQVELMLVDMSRQASIRSFAKAYLKKSQKVDALIHNAAFFDISQKLATKTSEGIETTWATNHLGPVLLTDLLMPAIENSEQGRILFVSSKGLTFFPFLRVNLQDPEFENRKFSVTKAYYQSKLAQVAYMIHLADKLKGTSVTVNGIRVTNVQLDLNRLPNVSGFMRKIYSFKSRFSISPDQMAQTYTWLATSDDAGQFNGAYFDAPHKRVTPSKSALDTNHRNGIMDLTRHYLPEI